MSIDMSKQESTLLLVGVMSYKSPVALGRRQALRELLRPAPRTLLRFVLARSAPDTDAAASDVLLFHVNESSRQIGTYLLNNAFFRYAVALRPRVPFIARADDDSFFDLNTVLTELAFASLCEAASKRSGRVRRRSAGSVNATSANCTTDEAALGHKPIVYGDFKEWYMWLPRSMQASCFDFSYARHAIAVQRLGEVGNAEKLPRFQRECLHADLAGPYPFAKGPLVAFSYSVASRLVALPELDADEAYAVGERKRVPLRSATFGSICTRHARDALDRAPQCCACDL